MADHETARRGLRIDPSDLLLEIVSIVIGVVLALAASQAVGSARDAQRTHEALAQIRQELVADDADLRSIHPLHVRVEHAFARTVMHAANEQQLPFDSMWRTFSNAAPNGFNPFDGSTTAWDLARGSDVLAEAPYAVRSALQLRYDEVRRLRALNAGMLERLETSPTGPRPNFYFLAFVLHLTLTDIDFSEKRLLNDDRTALDALARDGVGP